jgi:hypothetical protein
MVVVVYWWNIMAPVALALINRACRYAGRL